MEHTTTSNINFMHLIDILKDEKSQSKNLIIENALWNDFVRKKKINAWLFSITQGYTLIEKFKKFKKSVFIAFSVSAYSLVN